MMPPEGLNIAPSHAGARDAYFIAAANLAVRIIAVANDIADTMNRYRRHHPRPMQPGMVTWPTRRRRHRRRP